MPCRRRNSSENERVTAAIAAAVGPRDIQGDRKTSTQGTERALVIPSVRPSCERGLSTSPNCNNPAAEENPEVSR